MRGSPCDDDDGGGGGAETGSMTRIYRLVSSTTRMTTNSGSSSTRTTTTTTTKTTTTMVGTIPQMPMDDPRVFHTALVGRLVESVLTEMRHSNYMHNMALWLGYPPRNHESVISNVADYFRQILMNRVDVYLEIDINRKGTIRVFGRHVSFFSLPLDFLLDDEWFCLLYMMRNRRAFFDDISHDSRHRSITLHGMRHEYRHAIDERRLVIFRKTVYQFINIAIELNSLRDGFMLLNEALAMVLRTVDKSSADMIRDDVSDVERQLLCEDVVRYVASERRMVRELRDATVRQIENGAGKA